jgi:predicted extracellular nuclease
VLRSAQRPKRELLGLSGVSRTLPCEVDPFAKAMKWPRDFHHALYGHAGYLGHALASSSMAGLVASTSIWHINADEPSVLDYNTEYKSPGQVISLYAADEYRSSDHDPVIVELELGEDRIYLPVVIRVWP